ncbi:serine/threonine protein kinase Ran1 [Clydaea vesicula]|uniref:P-type Cu(+) transporter n=1 Tax=Clydaea vesicula TaxID=447962 RepID=A0AAD5XX61_9FUNG|nr:serine/threonine protein kinase Ran1 [Clydaea vesicula]
MTCASCVASIERHLKGINGISSCKVALLAERADVAYNPSIFTPSQVAELINEIGFEAEVISSDNLGEVDLKLFGMTCASCSGKIERAIKALPGINYCSVNLLGQTGKFKFEKNLIGVRDIVEKIESLGFNALLEDKNANAQIESLERTKETSAWKAQFIHSLCFALPVSIISMFLPQNLTDIEMIHGLTYANVAMMLFTIPIQFVIGRRFHVSAYKTLKHGGANMDVLVSLGTNISFFLSVFAMIYAMIETTHPATVFFETSSTLLTFISLGRWLENKAKGKTSSALSKLLTLAPAHAYLLKLDESTGIMSEKEIPSEFIQAEDLLKVFPGERIPTDGIIEFGNSSIDESLVTGEPVPVKKSLGDTVIGGTVNGTGLLHIRATRVGSDTTLSQIVKLVGEAQTAKAPIQAFADKISGYFVPAVVLTGLITFLVWWIILSCMNEHIMMQQWSFPGNLKLHTGSLSVIFIALNFGMSVIVVACPCALGLATPTAVMVGTGIGAQLGILIKGGTSIEAAYKVNKVIFDKTGTLTVGKLVVVFQQLLTRSVGQTKEGSVELTDAVFYALVGTAEAGSEHPLAKAIASHAKTLLNIPDGQNFPFELANFNSFPGAGIKCEIKNLKTAKNDLVKLPAGATEVTIGNLEFLKSNSIVISEGMLNSKKFYENQGHTVVLVAFNNICTGFIALSDALKPESICAVKALKSLGIEVAMVTGDQQETANYIAKQCGIDEVHAGVSPAGKKKIVSEMQNSGSSESVSGTPYRKIQGGFVVAMVGDGVNDSASIAQADVGIAVYGGTDVAVEAASVVLMRPDLLDVVTALDLSRKIFNRIRMNFLFASVYNVIMVPWAMGIFVTIGYPLSPMMSGMAMSFSSVSVVLSSLMLKLYKKPDFTKFRDYDDENYYVEDLQAIGDVPEDDTIGLLNKFSMESDRKSSHSSKTSFDRVRNIFDGFSGFNNAKGYEKLDN